MAWHASWNDPPERRKSGWLADRGGFLPPGVKLILFATVIVFILELAMRGPLFAWGAVTVRGVLRGEVWRLVTYMFLHASADHILINMFMFAMLGVALERQIGTRSFLGLYFTSGLAGGLLEVGFNYLMVLKYGPMQQALFGQTSFDTPCVGASAGVAGVLVAFAVLNPRAEFLLFFLIPIEAWMFALGYMLLETRHAVLSLTRGQMTSAAHAAHVGGMLLGFVWMKWGAGLAAWWRRGAPPGRERFVERPAGEEQAEIDRILDKIRASGVDSLTVREKMFLQEMSKKYRDRF